MSQPIDDGVSSPSSRPRSLGAVFPAGWDYVNPFDIRPDDLQEALAELASRRAKLWPPNRDRDAGNEIYLPCVTSDLNPRVHTLDHRHPICAGEGIWKLHYAMARTYNDWTVIAAAAEAFEGTMWSGRVSIGANLDHISERAAALSVLRRIAKGPADTGVDQDFPVIYPLMPLRSESAIKLDSTWNLDCAIEVLVRCAVANRAIEHTGVKISQLDSVRENDCPFFEAGNELNLASVIGAGIVRSRDVVSQDSHAFHRARRCINIDGIVSREDLEGSARRSDIAIDVWWDHFNRLDAAPVKRSDGHAASIRLSDLLFEGGVKPGISTRASRGERYRVMGAVQRHTAIPLRGASP